jgi:hypothetical protein
MIALVIFYSIWNKENTDAQNYTVLNECQICHTKGGQILMLTGQNLFHSINLESSFSNPTQSSVGSREDKFDLQTNNKKVQIYRLVNSYLT